MRAPAEPPRRTRRSGAGSTSSRAASRSASARPDGPRAAPGRLRADSAPSASGDATIGRVPELHMARVWIGLLDRVGDHDELADRAAGGDRPQGPLGFGRLVQKIADEQHEGARAGRGRRRQRRLGGPAQPFIGRDRLGELSITPDVARGRVSPRSPARSPLLTQRSAKASATTAARSILVAGARLDPNRIEADRSNQIQTVWADSHSRSRTNACSPRAERRQSTATKAPPK